VFINVHLWPKTKYRLPGKADLQHVRLTAWQQCAPGQLCRMPGECAQPSFNHWRHALAGIHQETLDPHGCQAV